jgi:2-dehydro-3-deoxy-D-gluconate 5-dehydrogenase
MERLDKLLDHTGKVALVTGAAHGIGAAVARRLAELGASVAVADIAEGEGRALADELGSEGKKAAFVPFDASAPESAHTVIEKTVQMLGRLDIVVNNAGIFPFSPAEVTPVTLWDRVLSVNLRAPFLLSQKAVPHLRRANGGAILNISSVDAFRPTGNLAHYDASKAGLGMLTRSLALEFAPYRIRVNAIAPGAIDTPGSREAMGGSAEMLKSMREGFVRRIPMGRMGDPDEIARVAVVLTSRLAEYVTGTTVVVDGGFLLS